MRSVAIASFCGNGVIVTFALTLVACGAARLPAPVAPVAKVELTGRTADVASQGRVHDEALESRRPAPVATAELTDRSADAANQDRLHELLESRQRTAGKTTEYVLGPGDVLAVTIYNFRPGGGDFASDVRVDDQGYFSLPMMDPVQAAGLTLRQLRRKLVHGLRQAEILNEPLLTVSLKEYQAQRIIVLGAVARPGQYNLSRGGQKLADVLSMAGGLTDRAGNYILCRPAAEDGAGGAADALVQGYVLNPVSTREPVPEPGSDMIVLPLQGAAGGTDPTSLLLPVRSGDLFIVPQAGQAFIEGEVKTPGPYQLSHGMTLTQLIASAGGPTFPADPRRVTLVRARGAGKNTQWEVDIEQIRAQVRPDILLEPNDRVVVPAEGGRKVIYGMYKFVASVVRLSVGGNAYVF